jgi:2'-5' RNA ligase
MFVAAWPDARTRELLSSLDLPSTPGLRLVRPDEWHVTLRFLGEVDEQLAPSLVAALTMATRTVPRPVRAVLGPGTAWFAGERVLQVPVTGLDDVAVAVRSATVPVVPARGAAEAPFVGHLTLARAGRHGPDAAARVALAGIACASVFPVDAVHLVGSRHTPDGARYPILGSALLAGG